jgi:hypothetical protein
MAGLSFLLFVLVGVIAFALPCSYLQRAAARDFFGWRSYAVLLAAWSLGGLALFPLVFTALYEGIAKDWP